jgi:hypothetical protein
MGVQRQRTSIWRAGLAGGLAAAIGSFYLAHYWGFAVFGGVFVGACVVGAVQIRNILASNAAGPWSFLRCGYGVAAGAAAGAFAGCQLSNSEVVVFGLPCAQGGIVLGVVTGGVLGALADKLLAPTPPSAPRRAAAAALMFFAVAGAVGVWVMAMERASHEDMEAVYVLGIGLALIPACVWVLVLAWSVWSGFEWARWAGVVTFGLVTVSALAGVAAVVHGQWGVRELVLLTASAAIGVAVDTLLWTSAER